MAEDSSTTKEEYNKQQEDVIKYLHQFKQIPTKQCHICCAALHNYPYYCDSCAPIALEVTVQDSTIVGGGQGLFATRGFGKHDYISLYSGEFLTEEEYRARYPQLNAEYCLYINQMHCYVDAINKQSCIARWINHATKREEANTEFINYVTNGIYLVIIQTTREIAAGEELFLDYGPEFEVVKPDESRI
jgi:SET domain-containing protein